MAFVSASPKNIQFANRSSAQAVGPGQYDIDSTEHKQLMAMLRPKKNAPFNQTAKRPHHAEPRKTFRQTPGKLTIPNICLFSNQRESQSFFFLGPGQYDSKVGIFEKQARLSDMQSKDKFFVQDNGHVNMRTQNYSNVNKPMTQIQISREKLEAPGPGSYEIFTPIYT